MAKFVKLESGDYVNVEHIRYIRTKERYHAILDDSGQGTTLTKKDLDNILKASEDVFLVAINDTQTLGVGGGMTNEKAVDNLLGFIENFQKENSNPEVGDTKNDDDLISSVKEFIEDAKKDLEELDIKLLKNHLEVLKETIDDIEADRKEG